MSSIFDMHDMPHPYVGKEFGMEDDELSYLARNCAECFRPGGERSDTLAFRFRHSTGMSEYAKTLVRKYAALPGNEFDTRLKEATLYICKPSFLNVPIHILEQNIKEGKS